MANTHNIQGATAKSIRPFKSSEEYLYAMKEDLAEWLKELYGLEVGLEGLVEVLETGWVLCQHANNVTRVAQDFSRDYPQLLSQLKLPHAGVTYTTSAQPGTFLARDNVSNFIQWCRKELEIKDVLMFETEDLVLRKNEKNFVLCLLEVARRASKFGMLAPVLIQMEEEIEEEIREEMDLPPEVIPPKPKPQKQLCDFKNLDEMVRHLVSRCTCPDQFPMVKVSEGKYKVGDSSTLIFVRILRNHVMVRVGGGWDTLEHYLDKHDPCRCTSLTHKQVSRFSSPHRAATPVHEIKARLPPRTDQTNKPQTALILSRSQSPMPPVEWRLTTPSALSLRSHSAAVRPLSPDVQVRGNSATRNPRDKSEPRQLFQTSISFGVAPYKKVRMGVIFEGSKHIEEEFMRDKQEQVHQPLRHPGQGHQYQGVFIASSSQDWVAQSFAICCPVTGDGPCRNDGHIITSIHATPGGICCISENCHVCNGQKDRPSTPSYQVLTNVDCARVNSNTTTAARTGREKSRALPVRSAAQENKQSNEPTMVNKKVPSQLIVPQQPDNKLSRTWTNAQFTGSKVDQSRSNANKQSTGTFSQTHKPTSEMTSRISKGSARNHSPAPGRLSKFSVVQDADKESERGHVSHRPVTPAGTRQESCRQESKCIRKPLTDGAKKPTQQKSQIRSRTPEPYSINNNNNNNKGVNNGRNEACLFTPPPINPAQESELYKSLEDEIASNMKALEVDLDEDNLEDSGLNTFSSVSSLPSSSKQKEFKRPDSMSSSRYLISSFPGTASHFDNSNRPYSCSNVASPGSIKVTQNGNSFDAVLAELVSGTQNLNRVDIENWIAKSPPEMAAPDSNSNLEPAILSSMETSRPFPNRIEEQSARYTKIGSTDVHCNQENNGFKDTHPDSVKNQATTAQNDMNAIEVKSIYTNEGSDTNSSFEWPEPPCSLQKPRVQQGRQKRSLKKPERVPSIYKLKLRPKIRPRRDNRPEKRPSKIPTPLSYRQEDKTLKGTTKSGSLHKTIKANSKIAKSKVQGKQIPTLYFTKSKEDLGSEEDHWPPQYSVSSRGRTAVQQSITDNTEQRQEDEESWV